MPGNSGSVLNCQLVISLDCNTADLKFLNPAGCGRPQPVIFAGRVSITDQ
jgi:hypothetical protein